MATKTRRRRKLYGAAAAAVARSRRRADARAAFGGPVRKRRKRHAGVSRRRRRASGSAIPAWRKYYLRRKKKLGYGYYKPKRRGARKSYRRVTGLRRGRHRVKGTLVINRPRRNRSYRRRNAYRANPMVTLGANPRRRRHYRRNPMPASLSFAGMDFKKILPLALAGAGAVMAPGLVVGLLNKYGPVPIDSPMKAYGVQAVVAVGGMMALNKWMGKEYGMIWIVTSAAAVLNSLLQNYVFGLVLGAPSAPAPAPAAAPAAAGLGYLYPTNPSVEIGAYPQDFVGAYPNELHDVGYYPYDGGYPV